LESAVRGQLKAAAGLVDVPEDEALRKVFSDAELRSNRDLARLLAAVPDIDGTINSDGVCQLRVNVPPDSPSLDADTWLVLVVG
jgi:hypothetical protein